MDRAEAKKYFEGLAQKSGLPAEKVAGIMQALDDEATGKLVLDAFVPRPEFSRGLDEAKAKVDEITRWHQEKALPAYETNKRGAALLQQYIEKYGDIATAAEAAVAAEGTGLTKAQVQELLNAALKERDSAYVGLTKTAVRSSQDYFMRFKEPLPVDELEKYALEKGLSLDAAYKEFIEPKVQAQTTAEWEQKLKAAREEGARDALSKVHTPLDGRPRDATKPHPFWDRKEVPQGTTEQDQDRSSRDAFYTGWEEPKAAPTA